MALDLDTYIELEANCFPPGIPFFALVISKCGRSILVQIKMANLMKILLIAS